MHHVYWSILGLFAQAPRGEVLIREAWLPLYYQSGLPVVSRLADPANNTDAVSLTTCARHLLWRSVARGVMALRLPLRTRRAHLAHRKHCALGVRQDGGLADREIGRAHV